ncbi:MAG: hypothetical protein KJ624_00865 [Chloroflexi bacterium]|nr:hypothetical protein [Chloroflexota bacterium]
MRKVTNKVEAITVGDKLFKEIAAAIDAALSYETQTRGKRKLGITGEVGEVLVCYHLRRRLGLRLVLDSRSEGFDAIDGNGLHVQIKTRRSESDGLPKDVGRTGVFSKHGFDYALLALLDHNYRLCEVWRADYDKLKPIIEKQKRRMPSLRSFKGMEGKPLWRSKIGVNG